ncbi:MAG: TatD family hydrolase [Clostridia bacterium]|nr:TatD family hydrolase [Clostridia bacterium]
MIKLFDTHAHLNDEAFDADREAVIECLGEYGVARVIDVACDVRNVDKTLALLEKYPFIYGTAGMHPHDASAMDNFLMDRLKQVLSHKKMLALGEIGLDYHYDFSPRETQRKWFVEQLELARELDMPVTLHIREAFGDCMDILKAHKNGLRGVMHCYSGSVETAYECLDLGLAFSFGGAVTFKNAKKPIEAIEKLPLESILLETDCPYMTPVPYRGKRNDPSFIGLVAEKIAEIKGLTVDELAEVTFENANMVFEVKGESIDA